MNHHPTTTLNNDAVDNQFELTNALDIRSWLKAANITHFTIHPDLSVDVVGDVNLWKYELECIPVQFNRVTGSFDCSDNNLSSLLGAPRFVGQDFNCSKNKLTSLLHCPVEVGSSIFCQQNQLTSLQGLPNHVKGNVSCTQNRLTSLSGAPQVVDEIFDCSNNQLQSLEHCPRSIGKMFFCTHNNLSTLEFLPEHVGKKIILTFNPELNELQKIQNFEELKIALDTKSLNERIQTHESQDAGAIPPKYKI